MRERLRPLRTKFARYSIGLRVSKLNVRLSNCPISVGRLRVKLECAFLLEEMCVEENSCMPVLDWLLSFNEEQ